MKTTKVFFSGVITTLLCVLMVNTVFGAQISKTITAVYNDIKIVVDGKAVQPKDAAGNAVDPFIYDGTTYLPVRAVADVVGYDVAWDGNTNTVGLSKTQPKTITLGAGDYVFGADIEVGKYNLKAVSGTGNITFIKHDAEISSYSNEPRSKFAMMFGVGASYTETFDNLVTENGDIFQIRHDVKIEFTKVD